MSGPEPPGHPDPPDVLEPRSRRRGQRSTTTTLPTLTLAPRSRRGWRAGRATDARVGGWRPSGWWDREARRELTAPGAAGSGADGAEASRRPTGGQGLGRPPLADRATSPGRALTTAGRAAALGHPATGGPAGLAPTGPSATGPSATGSLATVAVAALAGTGAERAAADGQAARRAGWRRWLGGQRGLSRRPGPQRGPGRRDPGPQRGPGQRPMGPPPRRALPLVLIAALAGVGGLAFGRLFSFADLRLVVPVAAVAPVLLVGLLSAPRRGRPVPLAVSVAVSAAGFVAWAVFAVAGPPAGGDPLARLRTVWTGVLDGPTRLLDVAVPAPPDPDLLTVPVLVAWLAAAVGAELVTRTRARLLPALPAVLGLLAATAAAVPAPGSNLVPAAVMIALAGLLVLARRTPGGEPVGGGAPPEPAAGAGPAARITVEPIRPGRLRALARASVALTVVVAAGLAAGDALPALLGAGRPVDPRAHRSPPVTQAVTVSPLAELAGWGLRPDEPLFTLRLSGQPTAGPVPLRLAVLAGFDGARWGSPARYPGAGGGGAPPARAPPGRAGSGDGDGPPAEVTQELTISGLTGVLVPAMDRPVQLAAGTAADQPDGTGGLAVDAANGLLARTEPLAAGDRFTIVSAPPPLPSVAELVALTTGPGAAVPGPGAGDYLALPAELPGAVTELAEAAAGQGTAPFQQAALLARYLATYFQFDPSAPPGHALGHLEHFIVDSRRGTSEQFATTFVLAARVLGLPSRVVVGFAPTVPASDGPVTVTVTGRDALAWAEVWFDDAGWLPFFPTPAPAEAAGDQGGLAGTAQGEPATQAALLDAAADTPARVPPAREDPPADQPSPSATAVDPRWLLTAGVGVGAALAAGYLLLAFARPAARRRRRLAARGSPRGRVVSAWAHAVDALTLAGVPIPVSATPAEVVRLTIPAAVGTGPAASALRGLATLATVALFGPDTGPAVPREAGQAGPDSAAAAEADGPAAVAPPPSTGTAEATGAGDWSGAAGRRAADEARRFAIQVERASWRALPRRRRLANRLAPRHVLGRG
ncbi:MAG: hypothetical protein IRZ08_03275 [Frankia sp.]|nr:hypothetical protein [Frankia sp.]